MIRTPVLSRTTQVTLWAQRPGTKREGSGRKIRDSLVAREWFDRPCFKRTMQDRPNEAK